MVSIDICVRLRVIEYFGSCEPVRLTSPTGPGSGIFGKACAGSMRARCRAA